ncbi:serine/threonine-protein phosphatase 7 long form [Cinnamomum micranthum f. kanehirae]|uniref:Serine/threonine-protein phosphatase 7 long form n=1 Tax=Cinnamomum micranthum f. kanehirae TaxID=337451 RepID=A0A443NY95_9MAGN|nr:serine/threonine-protein phosphatase 7 long form [Cinnamomum micranthum f. kanehirae]
MQWVADAGLYHLAQMRWMRIDHALLMGLIERWRPKTNTFHLPSGEATITLEDVAYIYGLPIDGPPVTGRTYTHHEIDDLCWELLGVVPQMEEDYNGVSLKFTWLECVFCPTPKELREKEKPKLKGKKKRGKGDEKKKTTEADDLYKTWAYFFIFLFFVAGQIICNSLGARGPFYILELLREFRPYSLASACLANLYKMLNKGVSGKGSRGVRCPTLPMRGMLWRRSLSLFLAPSSFFRALFTTDSLLISYWVLERHPTPRVMRQFGMRQTVPPLFVRPILQKENKERFVIDWSLVNEEEVKSWEARANNVLKRKGKKSKGGEDEEEYMRWYEANTIMHIGCVRQLDEPQRDPSPQPDAQAPTIPQTRVSLFLEHMVRSCDRSIVANVDLLTFITLIKKKVNRFRSTFGTTYQDYVETCSSSDEEVRDALTVKLQKHVRIKGKSSKSPAKKPRPSIEAPLMIEDFLVKASASHTLDEEQKNEVDASNFDATFGDVDDILIEDLISVSPCP